MSKDRTTSRTKDNSNAFSGGKVYRTDIYTKGKDAFHSGQNWSGSGSTPQKSQKAASDKRSKKW